MKNYKKIILVAVVVIILGTVLYLPNWNKLPEQTQTQTENNQDIPKQPEIPKFIIGSVLRVEGPRVFLKVGDEEKIIITDEKTVIVSQIKDEEGYKNIPITLSDIKISSQIVVYYNENIGLEYRADRIQIISSF